MSCLPPARTIFVVTSPSPESEPNASLVDSPCLQGEHVAFTGTLASVTHQQGMDLVARHGGASAGHVSSQTTMLVVGEEGWPLESNGQPAVKLQEAAERKRQGQPLRIINESIWLQLLDLGENSTSVHRVYTPAMLSQLLGVPVHVIRRWERVGLIQPIRKVFRLPYFSFQEVANARRLSELLLQGVPRSEIESSLGKLDQIMGGSDRPLAQLQLLARDSRIVYRDGHGFLEPASGQRLFDFDDDTSVDSVAGVTEPFVSVTESNLPEDHLRWTFRDWFDHGRQLLEDDDAVGAIEAFRMCLMDQPGQAEVNFHLAEALYRSGRSEAALERYYTAVETDHDFIEAWTQLGCLHEERGELEAALEAFQVALDAHPDFPDAHWHKAEVLWQLQQSDQAVPHWRRYLEFDGRGPWAETARQRLDEAGALLGAEA